MAREPALLDTVWILGDQLNRRVGALADREPGATRVLLVTSESKIASKRWHRQRLHLVLSAMAHFAAELRAEGFEVDHRAAPTLLAGLHAHREEFAVRRTIAMEPMSWDGRAMLTEAGVDVVANDQFLCHYTDFAEWASGRNKPKMEDFYRWQRIRCDILMESATNSPTPAGGKWNFDHENREPPPRDGRAWPGITRFELDDIDTSILENLDADCWGSDPDGTWPVNRAQALTRLDEFISTGLDPFGAHEDAMLGGEWKLAHSVLSSSLNLGLLHPAEVVEAAEAAYRSGHAPINSVEGFIRQVIGWREYVWGFYWLHMPDYRHMNSLNARARYRRRFVANHQRTWHAWPVSSPTSNNTATPTTSSVS